MIGNEVQRMFSAVFLAMFLSIIMPPVESSIYMTLGVGDSSSDLGPIADMIQHEMAWPFALVSCTGWILVAYLALSSIIEIIWIGLIGLDIRAVMPTTNTADTYRRVTAGATAPATADELREASIQNALQYDPDLQYADLVIGRIEDLLDLPRTVPTSTTFEQWTQAQFDRVLQGDEPVAEEMPTPSIEQPVEVAPVSVETECFTAPVSEMASTDSSSASCATGGTE